MPFVAEELYRNLGASGSPEAPESVHLADFPVFDESRIDTRLSEDVHLAMDMSSLGRATRSQAAIKVRQPLPVTYFGFKSLTPALSASLDRIKPQLLDELNVKDIKWDTLENVAAMEKQGYVIVSEPNTNAAVSRDIPESLKGEGMAREIVHRLQTMRRTAGFEIADRIVTYYEGDTDIKEVLAKADLADYIKQETLSDQLHEGVPAEGVFSESFKLEGHGVRLGVKRPG
jgi:isoleucyl-tRNA synthetase